jgi:intein/homing endonuclease
MKFQNFSIQEILPEMLSFGIRAEMDERYASELPVTSRSVYKWRRLNSFPLEFILQNKASKHVTALKSGNGNAHSRIRLPGEFNPEFAYLLGAMRDGSLIKSHGKHFVRLYDTKDARWITEVRKIFRKLFELEIHLRYQKTMNTAYLDISSKPLYYLLRMIFGNNMHKGIPEIIKTAPSGIKKAFVSGFFDAEGHVPHKFSTKYQIDLTQNDYKSLEFSKQFIESCGIRCGKISGHRLPIYGKDNIRKFHETFSLLNKEKSRRLTMFYETPSSA